MTNDGPFVWTRMQSEAGQGLERIIARKEMERRLNGGVFLWGVGNAPARAMKGLALAGTSMPVVFSRMLSKPRAVDSDPEEVVAWTTILMPDGSTRPLPTASIVTSRRSGRTVHHALHCTSMVPLLLREHQTMDASRYVNYGPDGREVGASQVTALVIHDPRKDGGPARTYPVSMSADLTCGMWTRLLDPVVVTDEVRMAIDSEHDDASWLELCRAIRRGRSAVEGRQKDLFA